MSPITRPQPRAQRHHAAWASVSVAAVTAVLIGTGPVARGFLGNGGLEGATIRSLAVLPLENLSGDASQEFFADGMTDALIADLSQVGSLRVISRTSSMRYKGSRKSLPEIARELDVEAVVEGSVVRARDRVRITAQLVHVPTDQNLWARSFEGRPEDVIDLQREVARSVAREVNAKLTPAERGRLASPGPIDPEAHEAYLRGKHFYGMLTGDSLRKAREYFNQALRRNPQNALALVALADTQVILAAMAAEPLEEGASRAREALRKAIALDPALAEAYSTQAYAAFVLDRDWSAAEAGFLKSLQLNPNLAQAYEEYGWYLAARGRLDEGLAQMRKAKQLDPLAPQVNVGMTTLLLYKRQTAEASRECRQFLELDPSHAVGRYALARIDLMEGRPDEAVAQLKQVLAATTHPGLIADLAHAYAASGNRREALSTLDRWRQSNGSVHPEEAAHVYAALGDKQEALRLLEQAYAERSPGLVWLKVDPRYDALVNDPRFTDLLKRLGLNS